MGGYGEGWCGVKFAYYSVHRPAGPGACPMAGLSDVEVLDPNVIQPEIRRHAYSKLFYIRELTREELSAYELLPPLPPVEEYKGWEIVPDFDSVDVHKDGISATFDTVEEAKEAIDRLEA